MKSTFAGHPAAALLLAGTLAVWLVIEFRKGLNRRAEATTPIAEAWRSCARL